MTLPTGQIAMSDVNVELNRAWNTWIDMNWSEVRRLAGRPSGQITMWDLRGKSNYIRDPASGWYYTAATRWEIGTRGSAILGRVRWNNVEVGYANSTVATSATFGAWTYYRGALRSGANNTNESRYEIYRDSWSGGQ